MGYERIKGLRATGQRRDGACEVNRSRTTVSVQHARLADPDRADEPKAWWGGRLDALRDLLG